MINSKTRTEFDTDFANLEETKERALLDFKTQLAHCRLRLLQQIGVANILDRGIREQVVRAFGQELETVEYQFLQSTTDLRRAIQAAVTRVEVNSGFNPGAAVAALRRQALESRVTTPQECWLLTIS